MTQVKPFIKCVDFWPHHIPHEKMAIYRQMIEEKQIRQHTVIFNRQTGSVTVEYYATVPHEWIREELAGRAAAQ